MNAQNNLKMNDQEKTNIVRLFNTQNQQNVDSAFMMLLGFLKCPYESIKFYLDNTKPLLIDSGKSGSLDPRQTIHLGIMIVPLFDEPSERTYHAKNKTYCTKKEVKVLKDRVLQDYRFYSMPKLNF
jgi:hypothetical protein